MIASEINHIIQVLDILVHVLFVSVPLWVALSAVSFLSYRDKKDTADSANSALDLP